MGTFLSLSKPWTVFWLDGSEISLMVFGFILVLGLVGEFRIDHNPPPGLKPPSKKRKSLKKLYESLVIIGVAGEMFADGGIFVFSSHLQTIDERVTSAANERAGIAEQKAAQANLLAAMTESNNVALKEELIVEENFSGKIRMKMIAPRSLFFDDKKFVADLAGRPKGAVAIFVTSGNKSDSILALKIEAALKEAGWTVIPSTPVPDDFLIKRPDLLMGNILLTKKALDFEDLKTEWVEHPATNSDGSISMTNLLKMDTPVRAFKVAMGDCGVWLGNLMENPSLSDNEMQLILGIEQW